MTARQGSRKRLRDAETVACAELWSWSVHVTKTLGGESILLEDAEKKVSVQATFVGLVNLVKVSRKSVG